MGVPEKRHCGWTWLGPGCSRACRPSTLDPCRHAAPKLGSTFTEPDEEAQGRPGRTGGFAPGWVPLADGTLEGGHHQTGTEPGSRAAGPEARWRWYVPFLLLFLARSPRLPTHPRSDAPSLAGPGSYCMLHVAAWGSELGAQRSLPMSCWPWESGFDSDVWCL